MKVHVEAERGDLYEIIRCGYERGSMIIISNRDLEERPPLFNDALLAGAAMDRLLHHRQVLPQPENPREARGMTRRGGSDHPI